MECATNQAIAFCLPHEGIDVRYLVFVLLKLRKHLNDLGQGGTQQNISQAILLDEFIPIAPTAEQRRIVTRIDELFTNIADGEALLARARGDLDTWHRALLKAAVTGELTREWREHHEPNQTGELLLNTIRNSKSRKNRVAQRNQELESIELPEIPQTWA
jgi:type I restriction enzyme S subunit